MDVNGIVLIKVAYQAKQESKSGNKMSHSQQKPCRQQYLIEVWPPN